MTMGFSDVLWIFLMITALQPILKQRLLEMRRLRLLVQLEKRRGSRVIALVHRQEAKDIDDQTLILADVAKKALAQMQATVRDLLSARMAAAQADALADKLSR